jgi:predicted nucleic acid-binding Zn ribbon protein
MSSMDKRKSESQPLKNVIDKFLKAYSLENKMKEMDIIAAWPELMGSAVAFRTKSIKIHNKVLYLEITSSVMREELLNGKQIILNRINEAAGKELINDLWLG